MALRREERYQQGMQADITAYQSGFATSAEQAGAAKQFALFVKRNRRVTIAVAVALPALAAVSAWVTFDLARADGRRRSRRTSANRRWRNSPPRRAACAGGRPTAG